MTRETKRVFHLFISNGVMEYSLAFIAVGGYLAGALSVFRILNNLELTILTV